MKKRVFIFAAVILSSFTFSACEEEIILPNADTTEESGGSGGGETSDPGQWD